MTRELIIKNIMVNYGKHGITEQDVNDLIDDGLAAGQNYDGIYLGLKLGLSKIMGKNLSVPVRILQKHSVFLQRRSMRWLSSAGRN